MLLLNEIANAWGWKNVRPRAVIMQNAFGNVIFIAEDGKYWRICPEELSCEVVAADEEAFAELQSRNDFAEDWAMQRLVDLARSALGQPTAERCYCLKIPATLGGVYTPENFGTISRTELVSSSGYIAKQIEGLPDGSRIKLKITD